MTVRFKTDCDSQYERIVGIAECGKLFPLEPKHICVFPSESHTTINVSIALFLK